MIRTESECRFAVPFVACIRFLFLWRLAIASFFVFDSTVVSFGLGFASPIFGVAGS